MYSENDQGRVYKIEILDPWGRGSCVRAYQISQIVEILNFFKNHHLLNAMILEGPPKFKMT